MAGPAFEAPPVPVPPEAVWFAGIGSAQNRRGYLHDVREFMRFAGLETRQQLPRVAPDRVAAWRDALLARGLRAATVRRKLTALSSLFEDLVSRGAAWRNPVAAVARPDAGMGARQAPVLSARQARRRLDAPPEGTLKGLRDRAILAVLLFHGLTRSELSRLARADFAVDDDEPCLRVRGSRPRVLALHSETVERIEAYLARGERDDAGPLFQAISGRSGAETGRALSPGSVYRDVVRGHAEPAGLLTEVEGLGAHSLRATAAATALSAGAPAPLVRDWLGHASLTSIARYGHREPGGGRRATVRISYPKGRRRAR